MILNQASDKIVYSLLDKINYGHLALETYDKKKINFGDPDSKLKASIRIKDPSFNFNLIKNGSIGFAESYMKDEFETDNLSDLIEITARNINIVHKFSGVLDFPLINFIKSKIIKNTRSRSKENIAKHYDLGNDFFFFLLYKYIIYYN